MSGSEFELLIYFFIAAIAYYCWKHLYAIVYVYIHKKFLNGYGLLSSSFLKALEKWSCSKCSENIPLASIPNSIGVGEKEFILECHKCRNLSLGAPMENVGGRGKDIDMIHKRNTPLHLVLTNLIKKLKNFKKDHYLIADHEDGAIVWFVCLHFFRRERLPTNSYGDINYKWGRASSTSECKSKYGEIPESCPECDCFFGSGYYDHHQRDNVIKSKKCVGCDIPLSEMWQFKYTYRNDIKKIKSALENLNEGRK